MNGAFIEIRQNKTIPTKSEMVSLRNAIEVCNILDIDLLYDKNKLSRKHYDFIIFGYGSKFTNIDETVKNITSDKVFWLKTEYEQTMNPALYYFCKQNKLQYKVIQNYESDKPHLFLNLNLLIAKLPNEITTKKYDCIYYSRWRPDRAKYCKEYLQSDMYFSSDSKNFKKYKNIGCNPKWIKKITWEKTKETLNHFRYSLYLEDEFTHTCFNNLANRWYEAGFCNNVVFFDINCWNTIRKSEIGYFEEQIKDYIVSSYSELQGKIEYCNKDWNKHLAIQKQWRMSEMQLRNEMIEKLKSIIYET